MFKLNTQKIIKTVEDGFLNFDVNMNYAKNANIYISSKFLLNAKRVIK